MNSFRLTPLILVGLLGLLSSSCNTQPKTSYRELLQASRQQIDKEWLTTPVSPLTACNQVDLRKDMNLSLFVRNDSLVLGYPLSKINDALVVQWNQLEKKWYFETDTTQNFLVDNKTCKTTSIPYNPKKNYVFSGYHLKIYASGFKGRLMVFDPESPLRKNFTGLSYFDVDTTFLVHAKMEWFKNIETTTMQTSLKKMKSYRKIARLLFSIDHKQCSLTLFGPTSGSAYGFIPFTDATNGALTYGGGRYLELEELPDSSSTEMILDFNTAFNPYCAYSPYYNCPVVPQENDLSVEILAGEKAFKQ